MKNKTIKIIVALLLIATIGIMISQSTFASTAYQGWDTYNKDAIKPSDSTGVSESIGNMAIAILSVVQVVGMAVAVIMLIVLAIKYISAAPSDKAEIKKHAVVYVVGAVVLFAATGIMEIIKNFAGNITG